MRAEGEVTITVNRSTILRAIACLDVLSMDEREPQRYRDGFVIAAGELRTALGSAPEPQGEASREQGAER